LSVKELQLQDPTAKKEIVSLPHFALAGLEYAWNANALRIDSLSSAKGELNLALDANGALNLTTVIKQSLLMPQTPAESTLPTGPPLTLLVKTLALDNHALSFESRSGAAPAKWELEKIDIEVKDFALTKGHRAKLNLVLSSRQGGQLAASGDFSALPAAFTLKAQLRELPLKIFDPFVSPYDLEFSEGAVNSELDLELTMAEGLGLNVRGDVALNKPAVLLQDLPQPLFAAEEVTLKSAAFKMPLEFNAAELAIKKPTAYYRFDKGPGRPKPQGTTVEQHGPSSSFPIALAEITLADGAITVADHAVQPAAEHHLTGVTAQISDFSLAGDKPVQIRIKANAAAEAPLSLEGSFVPAHFPSEFDAALKIDRMPVDSLSPYAAKFLGREVGHGKLSVDAGAQIKGEMLRGSNTFVLHRVSLGKSVPSDNAVDIPIETIMALMRDSTGNIRIDLPVAGKITDPSFHYLGLIGRTLQDNLMAIAQSPFTLLGSLYNWQGGSLEGIAFAPLSFELSPAESEKLRLLAKAMADRPALDLEIRGGAAPLEFESAAAESELKKVADKRAANIKQFLEGQGVAPGRLFLAESAVNKPVQSGQISSELKLQIGTVE
jgi:hypothetical protein